MGTQTDTIPLLEDGGVHENENNGLYTGDGSVDIKGNPALKSETGNWRACPFILGNECCERLAFFGIAVNLVTYLTTKLHEGNVSAARNVTTWQGTCYLMPLIGAVLADACWGRYRTISTFSIIYFIRRVQFICMIRHQGNRCKECWTKNSHLYWHQQGVLLLLTLTIPNFTVEGNLLSTMILL